MRLGAERQEQWRAALLQKNQVENTRGTTLSHYSFLTGTAKQGVADASISLYDRGFLCRSASFG